MKRRRADADYGIRDTGCEIRDAGCGMRRKQMRDSRYGIRDTGCEKNSIKSDARCDKPKTGRCKDYNQIRDKKKQRKNPIEME